MAYENNTKKQVQLNDLELSLWNNKWCASVNSGRLQSQAHTSVS